MSAKRRREQALASYCAECQAARDLGEPDLDSDEVPLEYQEELRVVEELAATHKEDERRRGRPPLSSMCLIRTLAIGHQPKSVSHLFLASDVNTAVQIFARHGAVIFDYDMNSDGDVSDIIDLLTRDIFDLDPTLWDLRRNSFKHRGNQPDTSCRWSWNHPAQIQKPGYQKLLQNQTLLEVLHGIFERSNDLPFEFCTAGGDAVMGECGQWQQIHSDSPGIHLYTMKYGYQVMGSFAMHDICIENGAMTLFPWSLPRTF